MLGKRACHFGAGADVADGTGLVIDGGIDGLGAVALATEGTLPPPQPAALSPITRNASPSAVLPRKAIVAMPPPCCPRHSDA